MMIALLKSLNPRVAALALLASLSLACASSNTWAADFEKPVFEFQSKLAKNGNAKAQFFLAQMYEEGRGTERNAELARHWYEQARLNGYTHSEKVASSR